MRRSCADGAEGIRRAAKDLFARRGYDAVSISAIAQAAGSSKANIFHHFGNKQGLYFAVMREVTQRSVLRLREIIADDADAGERVTQAIADHLQMLTEDPERSRLMMREVMFSSPRSGQALADEVFGEHFAALTELLGEIGGIDARETGFLAFMLVAANVMLFHCRNVLRHMPGAAFTDNDDLYYGQLTEVLLRGLGNCPDSRVAV